MTYTLIESFQDLEYLDKELQLKDVLGIDTEFQRRSKEDLILSLLQVKEEDETYLIDCLQIKESSDICNFLSSNKVTKVFHSFKEDIDAINSWSKNKVKNIFDTQIAYAFLGKEFSIAYKDLVLNMLGVEVQKKETRSNWMRRPLSSSQLDYAASDVEFLLEIFSLQKEMLTKGNKYNQFIEEIDFQLDLQNKGYEDEQKNGLLNRNPITISKQEEKMFLKKLQESVLDISLKKEINKTLLFSKANQKRFFKLALVNGMDNALNSLPKWRRDLFSDLIKTLFKEGR